MEVIRHLQHIQAEQRGAVVTIGNFDGLHLGHQALLAALKKKGCELKKPSLVIIFEPQPNEYFSQNGTTRLMRFREKIEGFREQGIDYVLCLAFNETLASLPPETFVEHLVTQIAPSYILVGDDFRFGYKRAGDIHLLQKMGQQFGFIAENMTTFTRDGERVSSSRIRKLLLQGEMGSACALLGHPFAMKGRIAHGDKRGRLLGFPTANIHLHRKNVPINGVFVVQMVGESVINGVANVGTRPTVNGQTKTLLEVHLFDFDQDIYGKSVTIRFLKKLRDEYKFSSLEALTAQLAQDVLDGREYFARGQKE
jgi:riboflavin kinase/FMN adenylyltransferase